MGHFFLDIETYLSAEKPECAVNPFLEQSKVILIAYNYYSSNLPPAKDAIKPPILIKEWESGERKLLTEFASVLGRLQQSDPELKIHGFNILKFDLPFLFGRMKIHRIAGDQELYNLLFSRAGTDMMHLSSLVSDISRQKEQLWNLEKDEVNNFFGLQLREGTSPLLSRLYDRKEFSKLTDSARQDFHFEQLMNSFYLYTGRLMEGKA